MKKNKKAIIYIIVIVIVGAILLTLALLGKKNTKSNSKDRVPAPQETKRPDNKELEEQLGMTKKEAIEIVKAKYKGDHYKFKGMLNNLVYIVEVSNEHTKSNHKWEVDPSTQNAKLIEKDGQEVK